MFHSYVNVYQRVYPMLTHLQLDPTNHSPGARVQHSLASNAATHMATRSPFSVMKMWDSSTCGYPLVIIQKDTKSDRT
jgi:hypothetical protein